MAKLVFGMNQSLDGYVDHLKMRTGPALSREELQVDKSEIIKEYDRLVDGPAARQWLWIRLGTRDEQT